MHAARDGRRCKYCVAGRRGHRYNLLGELTCSSVDHTIKRTREQCLKILCGEYETVRIPIHGLNIYIRQIPIMDIEDLESQLVIVREEWRKVKHHRGDCELRRQYCVYHCSDSSV